MAPFPYNEDGIDRDSNGVCRGAMMGRPGADPRGVWPFGILTLEEAERRHGEALAFAERCPGDYTAEKVAEAAAVLEAVRNPYAGRLTLRRVPLRDGYDGGGAYWGARSSGESLWCAWSPGREVVTYVTACGYRAAADEVRQAYPAARIFSHGEPVQ